LKGNKSIFQQEETEITEFNLQPSVFSLQPSAFSLQRLAFSLQLFPSPFSLCAPVQNACVQRCMAKKEEMPVMEQKPGRYWGVIGREHPPFG